MDGRTPWGGADIHEIDERENAAFRIVDPAVHNHIVHEVCFLRREARPS